MTLNIIGVKPEKKKKEAERSKKQGGYPVIPHKKGIAAGNNCDKGVNIQIAP
jgi:hypothetical protein